MEILETPDAGLATKAETREPLAATELFGSFFLDKEEFALPASCIREVVNFPEKITAIPLSPLFLTGIFTLRGTVIPVVNLGRLFDPEAADADNSHKIAIIDYQQVQVGILFHATGEILRVRPEQRSTMRYGARGGRDVHGVVTGTIQLENGARLLQILDAATLINIENVPQVLALKVASRKQENNLFHLQAERRQCVSFHVGSTSFAFEMSAIREIIVVPELQSSVLNSNLCLGRINFRGSPVAVVDFSTLLGAGHVVHQSPTDQRIVIARIGDASVGFLVDSVDNIVSFFTDELLPIPLLSKARAGMFGGCISQPGIGEIIFLDHEKIFSRTEIVEISHGHANLYQDEVQTAGRRYEPENSTVQRKVYITFTLENTFAVEIRQIREIIDFSEGMTDPPGMPPFMHGILNLRQQMISVIDLRCLYRMPPLNDRTGTKILIVERGEERYGLMVDTVENIITVADGDRFPTPKIMRSNVAEDLRHEMEEVIDMATGENARQTLSVFESEVFFKRLAREWPEANFS